MSRPLELVLLRHGETDWNRENRIQGGVDIPLNEAGRAQARCAAERLADLRFDAAYSSDLNRAVETAELILAGRGLSARPDPRLREFAYGDWEGLTWKDIEADWPEQLARRRADPNYPPPGGERTHDFSARIAGMLYHIRDEHPEGGRVLVVSHGGSMAMMAVVAFDLPILMRRQLRVYNTGISEIHYEQERVWLVRWNDTAHLDGAANLR